MLMFHDTDASFTLSSTCPDNFLSIFFSEDERLLMAVCSGHRLHCSHFLYKMSSCNTYVFQMHHTLHKGDHDVVNKWLLHQVFSFPHQHTARNGTETVLIMDGTWCTTAYLVWGTFVNLTFMISMISPVLPVLLYPPRDPPTEQILRRLQSRLPVVVHKLLRRTPS